MADAGSPVPLFETIADNFKVTLFPMGEMPGGGVNNLLDFIKANPGKKSKEIKASLNLPQRTLERWLKELREQKKITFKARPRQAGIIFWMKNTQPPNNDNKADHRRYMGM
jgi:ATP-dependent DNA helicase RecG